MWVACYRPRNLPWPRRLPPRPPLPKGWSIALIVWLTQLDNQRGCASLWKYYVASGGLLAAFALSAACEAGVAAWGLRGSVFETRRRAPVAPLVICDMASFTLQASRGSGRVCYSVCVCARGGGEWARVQLLV